MVTATLVFLHLDCLHDIYSWLLPYSENGATVVRWVSGTAVDKVHTHGRVRLLHNEKLRRKIASLVLLRGWQGSDINIDKENIGELVQFSLGNIWLLEDIAVDAQVPTLSRPIAVCAARL